MKFKAPFVTFGAFFIHKTTILKSNLVKGTHNN